MPAPAHSEALPTTGAPHKITMMRAGLIPGPRSLFFTCLSSYLESPWNRLNIDMREPSMLWFIKPLTFFPVRLPAGDHPPPHLGLRGGVIFAEPLE